MILACSPWPATHKTSVDKSLNDLRDKRLLTVSADKISRIELVRKNQDIEFGRNKDEWQILKPKPLRADSCPGRRTGWKADRCPDGSQWI